MRNIIAATLACLVVGCTVVPSTPSPKCSTVYQCEIEGYAKAR